MGARPIYWVFDWLEENHLITIEDVAAFLPKYRVLDTLQLRAHGSSERELPLPTDRPAIVAAMGLDLTGGGIVCPSPSCLRRQVDKLLRHVWHYFDWVVADDVLTPLLTEEREGSKSDLIGAILQQVVPLLYLRQIGATEMLEFRPKHRCLEHLEENARLEGLEPLLKSGDDLKRDLAATAKVSLRSIEGKPTYDVVFSDTGIGLCVPAKGIDENQARLHATEELFTEYMVDFVADISASHHHHLPLGSADAFVGQLLRTTEPASSAEVMFKLKLPVLDGIPTSELIAIRQDNAASFEAFRNALQRAATDRLKLAPGETAARLAREIRDDVVEPELAKIRLSLASAEKLLAKKTAVGVFLGALATTCGLLSGVPPTIALSGGTAATLASVGSAASKHLETQSEISLSDMYFLWNAVEHCHDEYD